MESTPALTRESSFKLKNLRWYILGTNALVLALNYADRAAIGVGAPFILKEFGFSAAVWGIILGVFAFGYAPFCFIGGWTSDKFGPRRIMALCIIWWSIFTALTAYGFNFVSFLFIRLFFGFGEGPQGSVTAKTMGSWFPQQEIGRAMGIPQAFTPLGGAIAVPLVAWMIGITGNWRLPFIILGIFGILFGIGWYLIVRDKPEQHPWITAKELAYITAGFAASSKEQSTLSIWRYINTPLMWSVSLAFFGYAWVLFTFLNWYPVYLFQVHGVDIKTLAVTGAIPWITGTIGFMLGGVFSDWLGAKTGQHAKVHKWTIVICLTGVCITFAPSAMITSTYSAVALMSLSIFLLYFSAPNYWALVADNVHTSKLGGVAGFVHFIANLAGIFAPVVTGALVSAFGAWEWGFGIGAIIVGAGAASLAVMGKIDHA
ncbi:MAG: MFS transporter [Negativicutes bacterium]|nr:MFS transporter [Negativicutes bacterium]